ncbi:lytic transglycosylase domain-containing protein [Paenibacillus thalictri]|uniref:Lytic transglycosylase domain-containing protein n=1 Tax=Paenibacillus thalictri TaxID=2527873 RepID=A0A4Q9DMU7_9BACL|nr:lytic transglycosylase domain-containing protein [Paenibacillus thalictri]TBL75597.1 lytic transglycosylase domain-containing protein [Paenibacillus thalictri]
MSFWRKKRVFAILLLTFITILFYSNPYIAKWLYPIQYKQEITRNAKNYDIDPLLIAAMIRVESNFQPEMKSHKGAYGLMQLMPDTAEWIIDTARFSPEWSSQLNKPEVNIQVGSWYVSWLHKQFKGNAYAAIAGYNAGQGKVSKWLQSGEWDGTLEGASSIPYGETRHYVQRVLYYYEKYRKIYVDDMSLENNVSMKKEALELSL